MAIVTVLLPGATEITEMDDSLLEKREGEIDNDNEHTTWVEYWLPGFTEREVHRSAHVTLKKWPEADGEIGEFVG